MRSNSNSCSIDIILDPSCSFGTTAVCDDDGTGVSCPVVVIGNRDGLSSSSSYLSSSSSGDVIVGTIRVVFQKPFQLGKGGRNNNNNNNNNTCRNDNNDKLEGSINLLTIRLYGKEKVRMRNKKYSKMWARKEKNIQALATLCNSTTSNKTNSNHNHKRPKRTSEDLFLNVYDHELIGFPSSVYDPRTNTIMAGSYEFPFCITLPSTKDDTNTDTTTATNSNTTHGRVPSSTSYNARTKRSCNFTDPASSSSIWKKIVPQPGFRIQYKLEVNLYSETPLRRSMDNGRINYLRQTQKQPIWIYSTTTGGQQRMEQYDNVQVPSKVHVRSANKVHAVARLDDTIIRRSVEDGTFSDINLRLACRNYSGRRIRRIDVTIVETLRWNAIGITKDLSVPHEGTKRVLVYIRDVSLPTLQTKGISWFQSFFANIIGQKIYSGGGTVDDEHYDDPILVNDLMLEQSQLDIRIPSSLSMNNGAPKTTAVRTSYNNGRFVRISHDVVITFHHGRHKKHIISIPVQMVNTSTTKTTALNAITGTSATNNNMINTNTNNIALDDTVPDDYRHLHPLVPPSSSSVVDDEIYFDSIGNEDECIVDTNSSNRSGGDNVACTTTSNHHHHGTNNNTNTNHHSNEIDSTEEPDILIDPMMVVVMQNENSTTATTPRSASSSRTIQERQQMEYDQIPTAIATMIFDDEEYDVYGNEQVVVERTTGTNTTTPPTTATATATATAVSTPPSTTTTRTTATNTPTPLFSLIPIPVPTSN